jgi:putative addiction module CopG family antidote
MPTRNINLTPEMDRYVASRIESGQYANASEVLRAGLRALEWSEREDHVKLEALRAAVLTGEESGVAEGDVMGYSFSKQARLDLIEIAEYTLDRWGQGQAERYLDGLDDCFKRLVQTPQMGRSFEQIRSGYRRIEHGKHVVIYRADADGVFICRILHQRMLPERQLFEDL